MFGLKLKEKPAKENVIKTEDEKNSTVVENADKNLLENVDAEVKAPKNAENLENAENVEKSVLVDEKDRFNLAHLLGKTESGLKEEFYAYQIKELMKSVGKILPKFLTLGELDAVYQNAVKNGYEEICATPFYCQAIKNIENKYNKFIKLNAIIDYPLGESSFKARISDVKACLKNGNSLTVVLPYSAVTLGGLSVEKSRLNKLCKAGKNKVGVAVKADLKPEELKRVLKVIDGSKCTHITLLAENLDTEKISHALNAFSNQKGNKKVFVYSSIKTVDELSSLLECKADKIFTPNLEDISLELMEKFGIKN